MTQEAVDAILKKVKEVPPLPVAVQKLLEVVGDKNSSAGDLTRVLETDPALTGKVLKLVNSSFYGFSGKVGTLTRAVVILGYSALRNLALGLSAFETLQKMGRGVDAEVFWDHAITCAAGAQALADQVGYSEKEEAFIAGLLHDVGFYIISIALPDKYTSYVNSSIVRSLDTETEAFGLHHAEVGIRVLEQWRLPDPLCRVARFHHSEKQMLDADEPLLPIISLSNMLTCVREVPYAEPDDAAYLLPVSAALGIHTKDFETVLMRIDQRVAEARAFLNIAQMEHAGVHSSEGEDVRTVVVVSPDHERREWAHSLLKSFGHHVVSASMLSPRVENSEQIHLVLLDGNTIDPDKREKLIRCLEGMRIPVAMIGDGDALRAECAGRYPLLPFVFNRSQVNALIYSVV